MNRHLTRLLCCPDCGNNSLALNVINGNALAAVDGYLTCNSCLAWFRIEQGVLDVLPRQLKRRSLYMSFSKKFSLDLPIDMPMAREHGKNSQIEYFKEAPDAYENEVVNNRYFKALNATIFNRWIRKNVRPNSLVLDVGSGTGRQSILLVENHMRVVGTDISEEMLRMAYSKVAKNGIEDKIDFIVCDAERLPFRASSFDACTACGVLHHLPNKSEALRNISLVLREGGSFFSYDPHKSPARFIFDFVMKIAKLWNEEASDDPLLTESEARQWMRNVDIKGKTRLSTYVLPHIFNWFAERPDAMILDSTDFLLSHIPLLRKLGGVLILEGKVARKGISS